MSWATLAASRREVGELGDASGAVDDEIGVDARHGSPAVSSGDPVAGSGWLDGGDGRLRPHLDADVGASGHEEVDEVRVEALERAGAAVDDHRPGPGSGGDVGELEGHEPAADEEHPAGEVFEFEEGGAVDQVLVAGELRGAGGGRRWRSGSGADS